MTICFKTTFAFFANYLRTHEVFYLIRSTWPLKSKHINEVINFFITTSLFIHPNCLTYIEVFIFFFFSLLSHFSASCQMCLLAIFFRIAELSNFFGLHWKRNQLRHSSHPFYLNNNIQTCSQLPANKTSMIFVKVQYKKILKKTEIHRVKVSIPSQSTWSK